MYLGQLGWNFYFQERWIDVNPECIAGRVSEESKGLYRVLTEYGEMISSIRGSARFLAGDRGDLPVVGDWVALRKSGVIESILPRRTVLKRKAAGSRLQPQILCANIDLVFLVTSLNQELNLRRLERYLAIAWESGAAPIVLLTKADLVSEAEQCIRRVETIADVVPVHVLSAITGEGLQQLKDYFQTGTSAVFVGSSGVGKSTLINILLGVEQQRVAEIRDADDQGRHTTTSRQLLLLPNGGVVIDTPGMRELGLYSGERGLTQAFSDVEAIAFGCRFNDCKHDREPDCAVQQAIADGLLPAERLKNFQKLQAELRYISSKTNANEKRKTKEYVKRMCKAQKRFYNQ